MERANTLVESQYVGVFRTEKIWIGLPNRSDEGWIHGKIRFHASIERRSIDGNQEIGEIRWLTEMQ